MSITTFAELKTSIADFLNRDDLSTTSETFISLAEANFNRDIRHWRMEKRATANLDTQFTALPNDFLEPIRKSLNTADHDVLEMVGTAEISTLRAEAGNTLGKPKFFTIVDGSIEVFPSPDATYTLEMLYYEKIDALNSGNTSNWLLTNHPDVYLYGSLINSAPYLGEDNRLAVWGSLYQNAVTNINNEGDRAKTGGSGRRIKIRSY
tara:strand:- start:1117 stop:1737 length:621 start_codon:yes stop_codon:yes gene_type:complete